MAATLTWVLPAGDYNRRHDDATGRDVVEAGTYHRVPSAPVGAFSAVVAVPRGFVEAADVIGVVLFVGAAWIVIDRVGTLSRLVGALVVAFNGRGLVAVPLVSLFFAAMGALENMQEEIIPLVPALLLLGRGLGLDPVAVVAMTTGAAAVGSAFGPSNPFQAGIAMKLAQLPPGSNASIRWTVCAAAVGLWIAWTMRRSVAARIAPVTGSEGGSTASPRDGLILLLAVLPIAAYVYGSAALGWGFNELSAGFVVAGCAAGLLGGLGASGTTRAYLEGMQAMMPAAVLVGVARSLSLVLADGHVIDTILNGLAAPLSETSAVTAAILMIPVHALIHVGVPSVSGQAVLTMPIMVPLSDLLGVSRQAAVLAYQTGAGLTELLTPTNGGLMAVLFAAGVPFHAWIRFAIVGTLLALVAGLAGLVVSIHI